MCGGAHAGPRPIRAKHSSFTYALLTTASVRWQAWPCLPATRLRLLTGVPVTGQRCWRRQGRCQARAAAVAGRQEQVHPLRAVQGEHGLPGCSGPARTEPALQTWHAGCGGHQGQARLHLAAPHGLAGSTLGWGPLTLHEPHLACMLCVTPDPCRCMAGGSPGRRTPAL